MSDSDPYRILLVEDEPGDASLVRQTLRFSKAARFEVVWVDSLAAAAARLACQTVADAFHLVLLDLSLPDTRGLATVHAGRRAAAGLPLIVLTGHDDADMALQALAAGAQDYLVKGSFDSEALIRAIRYAVSRGQLEQRLFEAEERLRCALEGAGDGIWDWDLRTGRIAFAGGVSETLGLTARREGLDFDEWKTHIHPSDLPYVEGDIRDYLEGKTATFTTEHRALHPDGSWKWLLARGRAVLRSGEGRPLRILGTQSDISQHRAAEAALRTGQQRLRTLIAALPDLVLAFDTSGLITDFHVPLQLAGRFPHPESCVGRLCEDVLEAPEARTITQAMLAAMDDGHPHRFALHLEVDGCQCEFAASLSRLANGDKWPQGFLCVARDVSEEKAARDRDHLQVAALEAVGNAVVITDIDGRIEWANPAFESLTGYTRGEALHRRPSELLKSGRQSREFYTEMWDTILAGKVWRGEVVNKAKDGTLYHEELVIAPVRDSAGDIRHFVGVKQDVSERRKTDAQLRVAAVAFQSQEGMMVTDSQGVILRVNRAFEELTGYSAEEAVGRTPSLLNSGRQDAAFYAGMWRQLESEGRWQGEIWNRKKSGEIYPEWLAITAVKDEKGLITHYVSAFSDISSRKENEAQIRHLAFYDPLTGLPNRRLLTDRLHQALAASARSGHYGAVMLLDLDRFKTLNDTQGHDTGDQLLVQVAQRLTACVREGDTVARLGGDEFVVMLEDLDGQEHRAATKAEDVGEKIRCTLSEPFALGHAALAEYQSSASIGISLFRAHDEAMETLLKQADIALYQAKDAGRNAIRFFNTEMQAVLDRQAELENTLRDAIAGGDFLLHYQPQVDRHHRVIGAEALLRWRLPGGELVSPASFIPLAEETGLILPLGLWVLETACAQLAAWARVPATAEIELSVNVSARQFRQRDFAAQVRAVLAASGAPATRLKLELTESVVLNDVDDAVAKMRGLQELGVSFALDDFGTGYSSLSYLKRLPLDQIKIDQSFVRDIPGDPSDAAIVQTIISMAENLHLAVIAEGVETVEQHAFLDESGCAHYQGYLFGRPMSLAEFECFLAAR